MSERLRLAYQTRREVQISDAVHNLSNNRLVRARMQAAGEKYKMLRKEEMLRGFPKFSLSPDRKVK